MKPIRSSATPLYLTAFFVLGFALSSPLTATQPEQVERFGHFIYTGSLNAGRAGHSATLLLDGKVLVADGANGSAIKSAELYDPATGMWSFTAEIYDPATGTWSATGFMNEKREERTATLLSDGRVLVVGGTSDGSSGLASTEIYDPSTGVWTLTGNLITGRFRHTAALLRDGRVLVTGGRGEHFRLLPTS